MTDFLQILLEISVYAAVMVLAVLAIRALFARKISPRVISVLWLLVLLRLCVPFTLESPVHLSDLLPATPADVQADHTSNDISAAGSGYAVIVPDKSTSLTIPGTQPATANPSLPTAAAPAPTVLDSIGFWIKSLSLRDALAVLWGLGALAVLMTAVIQTRRFKRRIVGHGTAAPSAAVRIAESHRQSLHIRRRIRVLECDGVCAPMVFGFFRPYILLPAGFSAGIAPGRLSCILLHEVCHIKRRDILFGYIWLLAKAAHWFNPLVWLAYRLMSDDNELCCDRMVTRRLPEQQSFEYTQSLIDVFRLINKKTTLPAAASFCENRSHLSERVMRMLDPPKTSRPVMALTLTIALILTAACFTTACSLTAQPADSVNTLSLSPVAAAEPSDAPAAQTATAPVQEQDGIPDVWQEDILNADGEPFMRIDAPVTVPEADTFPVLEVAAAPLSQQQVSALTAYFSQGQTLTDMGDSLSVDEIQSQLDYLNSILEDSKTIAEYPTAEDIQSEIDSFELMLEVESKIKHETVDSSLTESPYHSGGRLHASFDLGGDYPAEIDAAVDVNNSYFVFYATHSDLLFQPFSEPALYSDKLNLTAELAATQAKELLTVLGFNDFEVVSVQRGAVWDQSNKQGYIVTCRQATAGIPVVFTSNAEYDRLIINKQTGTQTDPDTGEKVELSPTVIAGEITVQLDDTGVVSFQCFNTLKPGAVTEENPALMDFSEIQRLFKEQMTQIYTGENRTNDTTYKVTGISLAYSTMPQDDDSFRLIPAWVFSGCFVDVNGTDYMPSSGETSLMAFSAIDGTRLGYAYFE